MDLTEQFERLNLDAIQAFIADEQEEHLHLEFKRIVDAGMKSKEDKTNLAVALSGFANSGGGLIVWGVDCRKNADGIDCACGLAEITPLKKFIARLNTLEGEALAPLAPGIRHKGIQVSSTKGFAVTLVPESDIAPHMAKLGQDRYFKRAGDSFYRLEHFDLEDMFGRRPKPALALTTRIVSRGMGAEVIIGIKNCGRGSARAPYLGFNVSPPFNVAMYGLDGNRNDGMRKLHTPNSIFAYRYFDGADLVLHPGIEHDVCKVGMGFMNQNQPKSDLVIDFVLTADGIQYERREQVIKLSDFA